MLDSLFPQFIAGLARGMLYFLVASGLSLVFGVLGVVNFAHGAMYMLGAFLCYSLMKTFVLLGAFNYWATLIVAPIIVAIIAGIIERIALRRIYDAEHVYHLLLTWAFVYIIGDLAKICWGTMPVIIRKPSLVMGSVSFWGATIPGHYIYIVIPAFIIVVVGGLGSILGALVGSLLIGLVESLGILLIPRLSVVLIFAVMALVLIIRPSGLFGEPEER